MIREEKAGRDAIPALGPTLTARKASRSQQRRAKPHPQPLGQL